MKYISKEPLVVEAVLYDGTDESIEKIKKMLPYYAENTFRINVEELVDNTNEWKIINSDLQIGNIGLVVKKDQYIVKGSNLYNDIKIYPKIMFERLFFIM